MKCPLLSAGSIMNQNIDNIEGIDCLETDCAWWDPKENECIVHSLSKIDGELRYWGKALRDELNTTNRGKGYLHD